MQRKVVSSFLSVKIPLSLNFMLYKYKRVSSADKFFASWDNLFLLMQGR